MVFATLAIASIVIILLAKLSEQPPSELHGSVEENKMIELEYNINNCPRVSFFYSNPSEQTLFLRVIPDSQSTVGVTLSFFRYSIDNTTYFERITSCFATPASQCSIEIPKNRLPHAVLAADSNMDETVDTVLFRWECMYTTNVPLITGIVFLIVSVFILLTVISCFSLRFRVLKIIAILNENLNKPEMDTGMQMTLDEILTTEAIHQ